MFDKFGEFDSCEELNRAAAGFKAEGDEKSLLELAEENGIDKEDVEDYLDDMIPELATVQTAAYGKLKVEEEKANKKDTVERWALRAILNMIKTMCTEPEMAAAVRKKGKRAEEILKDMRTEASKHKSGNMGVACGTDRELYRIIHAYYISGDAKKEIKKLYGENK